MEHKIIYQEKHYAYITPATTLQPYIAHYTLVTTANNEIKDKFLNLIPDASGCIFYSNDGFQQNWHLWGATTDVVIVKNDNNQIKQRFFIEFLPQGLYYLTHINAKTLLNKQLLLSEVMPDLTKQLENIDMFDNVIEVIKKIEDILIPEIFKEALNPLVIKLIRIINSNNSNISIKQLSDSLNFSERQLSRISQKYIGMNVKTFIKITRINYLLQSLNNKNGFNIEEFGLYDQSHYHKIFKELCHTTPTNYLLNFEDFYHELYKFNHEDV